MSWSIPEKSGTIEEVKEHIRDHHKHENVLWMDNFQLAAMETARHQVIEQLNVLRSLGFTHATAYLSGHAHHNDCEPGDATINTCIYVRSIQPPIPATSEDIEEFNSTGVGESLIMEDDKDKAENTNAQAERISGMCMD